MRHRLLSIVLAAGGLTLLAANAHGDVIVRLKNGTELRARDTWTENGLVKFEHRGGVVGFPEDAIASITKVEDRVGTAGASTAHSVAPAASAAAPREESPGIDPSVPEVKGEDLKTRMERLDDLSVKTYRELSIARSRGDSQEVVGALQAKIDEINRQRVETAKDLHLIH